MGLTFCHLFVFFDFPLRAVELNLRRIMLVLSVTQPAMVNGLYTPSASPLPRFAGERNHQ